jgi:transposase
MIAHYAQCYSEQIEPQEIKSKDQEHLRQLVSRRGQLIKMRSAEKNRLEKKGFSQSVVRSCKKMIEVISEEIQDIEEQIRTAIREQKHWRQRQNILRTVKGIGPAVSWMLLAKLPELGGVNRKKIAALVGVAPFQNQSGRLNRGQSIRAGRSEVRAALYLAVLSAMRHNPTIKDFYQKLLQKGKKKKVAQTACAHKLLRMLNAMVAKAQCYKLSTA